MSENQWGHAAHLAKHTSEALKELEPLQQRKNPVIAFVLGFLLQGIGVGLYLESWKDFFVCVGIFVLFFGILLPTVIGEAFLLPAAALFCGFYGLGVRFLRTRNWTVATSTSQPNLWIAKSDGIADGLTEIWIAGREAGPAIRCSRSSG